MAKHGSGTPLQPDEIERILWSARRAGTILILPREQPQRTIDALTDEGLVRRQLGHIVLTMQGQERRRKCAHYMAAHA